MLVAARAAFVLALALAAFAPAASGTPTKTPKSDIASLPPVLQGAISATLGERDAAYRMAAEGGGYRARNARQALDASIGADGMAIAAGGGEWRMRLAGWQRGAGLQAAGALATRASGNRVEVERGGVTEWWVNGPVGLQQGWTLASRPFPEEADALSLVMVQSGSLRAKAGGDRSLDIADDAGRVVLRYGGLTAFDATGRELAARFEVASGEVRVRVEDAGAVYPVVVDPIAQQAYLKASNTGAGDLFGVSVAISGDTVVVGAPGEDSSATGVNGNQADNGASESGAAYVFVRSGATWSQQAYLKASNTEAGDQFGYSVAISGDTVVVGAASEASNATGVGGNQADNSAGGSGAAYVFVRSGTTWSQQAYLKASNTGAGDRFGASVAISGDTVVVGAYWESSNATGVGGNQADNSATDSGAAYVFVRSGTTWSQQAYLKASNTGAGDSFGRSVAISGDTVVVGAPQEDSNATGVDGDQADNGASGSGAAYVFVRSGTTWSQQAYLKASNTGTGDQFGASVAISGDTVVVGATGEDSSATGVDGDQADNNALQSGAAYVFVRSGTTWSQQAYLKASNTGAGDTFGHSVAISGDTVVVGATAEDSNATGVDGDQANNSFLQSGAAYAFVRSGTTWSQQAYLKASNTGTGDQFGFSVAISGDTAVVGALFEGSSATGVGGNQGDNSAASAGAAYVFFITHTVTPSAGANGTIAPATPQVVAHGGTLAFTVTPDAGYTASVGGTCGGTLVGNTYTTNPITAACTVAATFSLNSYTVTPSAGANGTITPATPQVVAHGGTLAFTVTPDAGYTASVGGTCGGTLAGNTYTTNAITGSCTVAATFALNSYTVTPSAGANGTITPATPQVVAHGGTTTFTVTPDAGYTASVGGTCGGTLVGNTYTTNPITAACTVAASFALNTYAVTPSAGANGTITPATPQVVAHGGTTTFTVTPDAGHTASVGGTCGGTLVGNTYTTNAITGNCTVAATFALNSYTVTPSAGANGTISPATPQVVAHGGTTTFTVTPAAGHTASVGGTCGGTLAGNTYTTNAITGSCTVAATFALNSYTVTPSAGANGTITPATPQTVAHGGTATFTVTPNLGYAPVLGGTCGGALVGNTYTTNAITGSCTVAATFTASPLNSYSGPSATGTGTITATFSGGGPACSYTVSRFIPVTGDPASPPAGTAPAAITFPHGLFDFTASACAPGGTITMTITYPQPLLTGTQYWKYGPTPSNPAPHWYVLPATIGGNTVTFTITDGQLGDDDLAANGTIVDQGGPGTPASAVAVPTLSEWAMLLLAGLVMLAGMGAARARHG